MLSARLSLCLVALVALVATLTQARAAPLDADTCAKLQAEQALLEGGGVEKDMAKGPDWAKANLGLERLQRVQRFIELEEQLLFRCRSKAIVHLVPEKEPGATADQDDDKNDNDVNGKDAKDAASKDRAQAKAADPKQKQQPDAGKKAEPQPPAKPAGAPNRQDPAKAPSAKAATRETADGGVTSIEKRPPQAKVDDAYKAPSPAPPVNPFAIQVAPSQGK